MSEVLLTFFKALADANRLRIVGLLAERERGVEELADTLGLRASTVSHHLSKLVEAGLLSSRVEGHFHVYALDKDALEARAKSLLAKGALPALATSDASEATLDVDAWDKKVLHSFTDEDGRIRQFPMQRKKFEAILRHVARGLVRDEEYGEKQLNAYLKRYSDDVATLRRGLIDHKFMTRDTGGKRYRLV